MRNSLSYTLLAEGASDRALLSPITWLLRHQLPRYAIQSTWADLRGFRLNGNEDKIRKALEIYPCDWLFIHRDADREPHNVRVEQIRNDVQNCVGNTLTPVLCVVPVRMLEAWLMFDEQAIRSAAGNPKPKVKIPLELRSLRDIEREPDPKSKLKQALKTASGLRGRHLDRFRPAEAVARITDFIDDYSPLRHLPAFQALEQEINSAAEVWLHSNNTHKQYETHLTTNAES